MKQPPRFELFSNGRTPGGSAPPLPAVGEAGYPPLGDEVTQVTVGIVDTGISLDDDGRPHSWFGTHLSFCAEDDEDVYPSAEAIALDPTALDGDGHGTFVAGLVLRAAPTVRVRMFGALDAERELPDGLGDSEDQRVAAALRMLALNPKVKVINLSFGGGVFEKEKPALLEAALADVDPNRVAVVAAVGNNPGTGPVWPAAFPGVVSVGALDAHSGADRVPTVADYSHTGDWVTAYAVGSDLLGPRLVHGTYLDLVPTVESSWCRWSGTSFAAAVVSGRIAALAVAQDLTGKEAADALLADAPVMPGHPTSRAIL